MTNGLTIPSSWIFHLLRLGPCPLPGLFHYLTQNRASPKNKRTRTNSPNQIKQIIAKVKLWSSTLAPGTDNNPTPESVLSPFTKLVQGKNPQQGHPASPPPKSGQESQQAPGYGASPSKPLL